MNTRKGFTKVIQYLTRRHMKWLHSDMATI